MVQEGLLFAPWLEATNVDSCSLARELLTFDNIYHRHVFHCLYYEQSFDSVFIVFQFLDANYWMPSAKEALGHIEHIENRDCIVI